MYKCENTGFLLIGKNTINIGLKSDFIVYFPFTIYVEKLFDIYGKVLPYMWKKKNILYVPENNLFNLKKNPFSVFWALCGYY